MHLYDIRAARTLRRSRDDFHLMMTDRPNYGPNTLFTSPHYLHGNWYLDEIATRHNSTLRLLPFEAETVPMPAARATFNRLQRKFVEANRSKFPQAPVVSDLPDDLIAIF